MSAASNQLDGGQSDVENAGQHHKHQTEQNIDIIELRNMHRDQLQKLPIDELYQRKEVDRVSGNRNGNADMFQSYKQSSGTGLDNIVIRQDAAAHWLDPGRTLLA